MTKKLFKQLLWNHRRQAEDFGWTNHLEQKTSHCISILFIPQQLLFVKGMVHTKIKILSFFIHPHEIQILLHLTTVQTLSAIEMNKQRPLEDRGMSCRSCFTTAFLLLLHTKNTTILILYLHSLLLRVLQVRLMVIKDAVKYPLHHWATTHDGL